MLKIGDCKPGLSIPIDCSKFENYSNEKIPIKAKGSLISSSYCSTTVFFINCQYK